MTPDETLDLAVQWLLRPDVEGGFSDNPEDHGGPTGAGGVSLRAVRLRDHDHDGRLDFDLNRDGVVDAADMRLVKAEDVRRLAEEDYWSLANCAAFPPRLAVALLDTAWLCGPRGAVAILQRALGLKEDGVAGPITVSAAQRKAGALAAFLTRRYEFHQHSAQVGAFPGWLTRPFALAEFCGGIPA